MAKYLTYFNEMIEYNKDLFTQFKTTHDSYATNPAEFQEEFNEKGEKVLRVIRRYENMLCGKSENSGYSKFSSGLSDKFWAEVRIYLPHIDSVGKSI